MLLGLLLGNTSLRYCTFDPARDDTVVATGSAGHLTWDELSVRQGELQSLVEAQAIERVVVGSVRDDRLPRVLEILPERLAHPVVARRDFSIAIENCYRNPDEVGTDRLLNALAASERSGGRGAIVFDAGTALSISVVGPDRVFLGGSIGAGIPALSAGLAESTPCLKSFDSGYEKAGTNDSEIDVESVVATGTRAALRGGVYWQMIGGASRMLRQTLAELSFAEPRVYATGGDAPWIAAAVPEIDEVVPFLTLEGLIAAYRLRGQTEG